MNRIPTELNGYPVIQAKAHDHCVTVMCDKGDELVIATWWPELGNSWQWGHYLYGEPACYVEEKFTEVAERNARR